MLAEYAYNLYCKDAKLIDLQKIRYKMPFSKTIEHIIPLCKKYRKFSKLVFRKDE